MCPISVAMGPGTPRFSAFSPPGTTSSMARATAAIAAGAAAGEAWHMRSSVYAATEGAP